MSSDVGIAEWMVVQGLAILMGLIPIAVAIWIVVLLLRMQRSVDRMAAAIERLADRPPRER